MNIQTVLNIQSIILLNSNNFLNVQSKEPPMCTRVYSRYFFEISSREISVTNRDVRLKYLLYLPDEIYLIYLNYQVKSITSSNISDVNYESHL